MLLIFFILLLNVSNLYSFHINGYMKHNSYIRKGLHVTFCESSTDNNLDLSEENLKSPEITKKLKKIEDLTNTLENVRKEIKEEDEMFAKLDAEYGSEIARVKKEFSRMKERSYEEATEISNAAKVIIIIIMIIIIVLLLVSSS